MSEGAHQAEAAAAAIVESLSPQKRDEILTLLLSAATQNQQNALLGGTTAGCVVSNNNSEAKESLLVVPLEKFGTTTSVQSSGKGLDNEETDKIWSSGAERAATTVDGSDLETRTNRVQFLDEEVIAAPIEVEEEEEIACEPLVAQERGTGKNKLREQPSVKTQETAPHDPDDYMKDVSAKSEASFFNSPIESLRTEMRSLGMGISHRWSSLIFHSSNQVIEEWHTPFEESVFTLFYMCSIHSQGFWYAVFVYILQMLVISLTLLDVIDYEGSENPLNIPAMVDLTVTVAQGVALFLALAYQQDLLEAAMKLQDGFYPQVQEKHPGATFGTWLFACLAQLVEGLMLLAATFILIMQVDSVLDIMLNFAGLNFIAEIDDLGFALAKMGFVTNELKRITEEVADFQVPKREHRNFQRRALYCLTLVGVFVGYGVLKKEQLDGHYLPNFIYVQFGDAYNPKLPYYSGLLESGNRRTLYHREYRDVDTQNILLSYCDSEESWTFSDTNESCAFFAKSDKTATYDVTTIADSAWHILDEESRPKPFDYFTLVARDCIPDVCHGECINGLCHCPPDLFGFDCEFDNVCPELVLHGESEPFPVATLLQYAISDTFHLLTNSITGELVRVNSMPVYYSNKTFFANIIFFGGRRWVLTSERGLYNDTHAIWEEDPSKVFFPERTAELLHDRYHGHHEAKHTPYFLSDPVDFETPYFIPTPSDLGWYTVKLYNGTTELYTPDRRIDAILTCSDCRADHGGSCDSSGGTCNQTNGVCDCEFGFHGYKCELQEGCYEMERPCYGDGLCDDVSGFCRCNLPFFGKLCDNTYFCFEEGGGCKNGGFCNYTTKYCDCPDDPAITGWACEKRKDCKVFGCENGGACNETTGICDCDEGHYGVLCSLADQTPAITCPTDPTIHNLLLCPENFNCSLTGCQNRGICHNDTGLCDCHEPYVGSDCSVVPDCFSDEDCIGGGLCQYGSCVDCVNKFATGKLCEDTTYSGCSEVGCFNGGTCQADGLCECSPPYNGMQCEYILDEDVYA